MMPTTTLDWNSLPLQQSFNIKQGDSLNYPVQLKIKSEAATTYSDLSLVGATLKLYVKKGETVVIAGTTITADTASEGKFTVYIPAATTTTWTGEQLYEVECTWPTGNTYFPSGATKTIIEGRILIRTDI